ncbi:MAG: tetraacyldisaccharide 4'-kinase [Phycisphaerales bacterium]
MDAASRDNRPDGHGRPGGERASGMARAGRSEYAKGATLPPHETPPPLPGPIGRAIERLYLLEVRRRNRHYDRGAGVVSVGVPVISVGNLSVGGTGKTPMVRTVVGWLRDAGHRPAIAMRGYRAHRGVSDEAAEYERELPGVPIAIGADRVASIERVRGRNGRDAFDCVVLDDGFQHRRVGRARDIVLLDATRFSLDERCLPAGWLREPVASLGRASLVVITRADRARGERGWSALRDALRQRFPGLPVAACEHRWDGLTLAPEDASQRDVEVGWLRGRGVVIACGIGNPGALVGQVIACGGLVVEVVARGDHHGWSASDARSLSGLLERAGDDAALLTTGKDWVKLRDVVDGRTRQRVVVPKLSLRFIEGEQEARAMIIASAASASG